MFARDKPRLEAVLSDELRYAHASGEVDGKSTYLASVLGDQLKDLTVHYEERLFRKIDAGSVFMAGRGRFSAIKAGQPLEYHLAFLAIWRREPGGWRLLAWQSSGLP